MTQAFQQRRARIGALAFILGGLFLLAIGRLAELVALDGPRLNSLAQSEHMGETELAAARGPIVDRNGEPLALSAAARSVYARPRKVRGSITPGERAKLAAALALTPAELGRRLQRPAPFVWLQRRIDPAGARAVAALGIDGVGALGEYKRFYPESNLAASVVGLAGMDGQGLSGLELGYDRLIRGAPVRLRFYHDALGHPIFDSPLALRSPAPGAELTLTLDARIQALAETELAAEVQAGGAQRGAAIVLDPFSGELLALANVSARPDPVRGRLHDPAVEDAFEPGSTMKALLVSIALADRALAPNERIYCENGQFRIGRRTIHDDSRHGWLDLGGIIEVSSNIGAAKIALKLGAERFYAGLRAFGLGRRTGIDLPGEAAGLLRRPSAWRAIELANHGFGQGIAVTPIQLAVAYGAIANGGLLLRPYLVKEVRDARGRLILRQTPQVVGRAVAPSVAHAMNLLLRGPVNGPDGTAHRARVEGFVVAGKTGTAQMANPATHGYFQNRHVASFVGFLPADDPRLLILVVLYDVGHGHFGGLVAAPVFSEIASGALRDLNIASETPAYDVASLFPVEKILGGLSPQRAPAPPPHGRRGAAGPGRTPGFLGLSLRRAFEIARRLGTNLEVEGAGYVVTQSPAPGAPLSGSPVRLTLASAAAKPRTATAQSAAASRRRISWRPRSDQPGGRR